MILRDNGENETNSESNDVSIPFLEDVSDGVEYLVDDELAVTRYAINMQVKRFVKVYQDNIFHTRCHINNKDFDDAFPNNVPSGVPPGKP